MERKRSAGRVVIAARATLGAILAVAVTCASPAFALEARIMKETAGATLIGAPCTLPSSTNGTAANYRWYNICSGYIWIFSIGVYGEAVGVLFGGPEQPEVNASNIVKRAITYWRNVVQNYGQTVDVMVDLDSGDGCPDAPWLQDLNLDPALRWNCSEFGAQIPGGIEHLIVRTRSHGGAAPTWPTDGALSEECDPIGNPRSFYYGPNGSVCVPWIGPTGRSDNFLYWLVLDRPAPNAVESTTWGAIKGLFR